FSCEDRFGVRVRQIEMINFYRLFDSFKENEVKNELANWRKSFDEISETPESKKCSLVKSEKDLLDATRVYLALRALALRTGFVSTATACGSRIGGISFPAWPMTGLSTRVSCVPARATWAT
ncbi:hypothetical protein ACFL5K_06335, partial [Gemmatimonadota bacterium]